MTTESGPSCSVVRVPPGGSGCFDTRLNVSSEMIADTEPSKHWHREVVQVLVLSLHLQHQDQRNGIIVHKAWWNKATPCVKKLVGPVYLLYFAQDDRGKFDSQLFRFLQGGGEANQVGQRLHADKTWSLFVRRLPKHTQKSKTCVCFHKCKWLKIILGHLTSHTVNYKADT